MKSRKVTLLLGIALVAFFLTCCNRRPSEMIAFINVNLIPMTSDTVIENQTVLVEGSEIVAVGDSDTVQIPRDTQVIDGNGTYLMPGLADMHMHTRADWDDQNIWPVHPLNLYLANGVTTIRDFSPQGSPLTYVLQWRDEIRDGTRSGPTIYASGKLLYASPLGDAEGIVQENYGLGFDFLKLYSYLSKDDFHVAMKTAKGLGMYTAGHIPYAVGLDGILAEGMDEVAHVEELLFEFIDFDRNRQLAPEEWMTYIAESALLQFDLSSSTLQTDFEKENINTLAHISQQLQSENIPVCTTMVVDDVIQLKLFQPEAFLERPENIYFEKGYLENFHQGKEKHQVQCRGVEGLCAFKYIIDRRVLDGLHDVGVLLLLGTDSGTGGMGIVPGYSIHDELRILVENGFSPYEALATGTVNAAIVIDRMTGEGDFGTVEVGNRADLILVKKNPLLDITNIKEPLGVMAAGRWYSGEMLSELTELSMPTE
jgi:hypothetical protein